MGTVTDGPDPGRLAGEQGTGANVAGAKSAGAKSAGAPADSSPGRPFIERIGLAFIALVLALMFGGVAVAAWVGGSAFLAVMAAIGALMTAWAGAVTLFKG